MHKALEIKNLNVSYQDTEALSNISLSVNSGKIVGIVGPNGAGKSTLIKAVLGLTPIDSGNIKIYGQSLNQIRNKVAYVPQRAQIDWNFPIVVKKTVLLGTYPRLGLFKRPKRKDKAWAMECLKKWAWKSLPTDRLENYRAENNNVYLWQELWHKKQIVIFLMNPLWELM